MSVPLNDLSKSPSGESALILEKIRNVILSGRFLLGEQVSSFEREFAEYIGCKHTISVANGTDALILALTALGIKNGAEVITVANAGMYSSLSIYHVGAKPIYADVRLDTMTMDISQLESLWSPRTAGVIITHLYGRLANIDNIVAWCKLKNVSLIEDCAQAHGAYSSKGRAGTFGDVACFSFYPTKNLGSLGDGGAITTSDASLAHKLRSLSQYGWSTKYQVELSGGFNSRLDEIQAAILRIRLKVLDVANEKRLKIAAMYSDLIVNPNITLPVFDSSGGYVAHLYVVRCKERASLKEYLAARGIATDIHYPIPDHMQQAYYNSGISLPITEKLCREILTLPCFPEMSIDQAHEVIDGCNAWKKND